MKKLVDVYKKDSQAICYFPIANKQYVTPEFFKNTTDTLRVGTFGTYTYFPDIDWSGTVTENTIKFNDNTIAGMSVSSLNNVKVCETIADVYKSVKIDYKQLKRKIGAIQDLAVSTKLLKELEEYCNQVYAKAETLFYTSPNSK